MNIRAAKRRHHNRHSRPQQNQNGVQGQQNSRAVVGKVGLGEDYYNEEADAVDREAYYAGVKDDFETADGTELYHRLNKLIKGHRSVGYKQARRHLYSEIDRRPDGGLYYLYSGDGPRNESEYTKPATHELTNFNCEHVVPQSWFRKKGVPKSDLHHLFTEQIQCNSTRSNFPLEETEGETVSNCGEVSKRGEQSFEPKSGKGAVARATLYFITRYPGEVGDSNRETQESDLKELLAWHNEYPVSDYERHRNETIQDVQGNRNPFIDFPELANKVDFSNGIG